jgi:hypothetical protein
MKQKLECEEVQKIIPKFIDGRTDSNQSLAFIRHIKGCKACMEELSVEYLVLVGVKRLDSASAFNLNDELDDLITRSETKAKRTKNISFLIFVLFILCAIVGGYFLSGFFY